MNIIPGILEQELNSIVAKAQMFSDNTTAQLVQIDLCDGVYVPSLTWPYAHDFNGTLPIEEITKAFSDLRDSGVVIELDMMIDQPEITLVTWLLSNPRKVIIHARSSHNLDRVFAILHGYSQDYPKFEYALAFSLDDDIQMYRQYIKRVHYVQIMGIRQIGLQGQAFDDAVLGVIQKIREFDAEVPVQIDGGVTRDRVARLVGAGVSSVVIGSGLFNSPDPRQEREEIQKSLI